MISAWLGRNWPSLLGLGAVALVLWLAYCWAYDRGHAARDAELVEETAAKQARIDALADQLAEKERALTAARIARSTLERRLADEAAQDPLSDGPGLGAGSLRRLDRIR